MNTQIMTILSSCHGARSAAISPYAYYATLFLFCCLCDILSGFHPHQVYTDFKGSQCLRSAVISLYAYYATLFLFYCLCDILSGFHPHQVYTDFKGSQCFTKQPPFMPARFLSLRACEAISHYAIQVLVLAIGIIVLSSFLRNHPAVGPDKEKSKVQHSPSMPTAPIYTHARLLTVGASLCACPVK